MSVVTAPLEARDAVDEFESGKPALDEFLAKHALANHAAGIGRTYVLRRADTDAVDLPELLGFYTLSMAAAESSALAPALAKKLPRYPMPVALIGRLAVDRRARGRGFGEALLIDALARVSDAAEIVGCVGVIVDAKDEDAARFYAAYGFAELGGERWPRRMFLSMANVRAALEGA